MDENEVDIDIDCQFCGKTTTIKVTKEQYKELQKPRGERKLIQDILPDLAPELRELFISGICPKCWDKMFKSIEE